MAALFALFIAFTIVAANLGISHPGIVLVRALPYGDKIGHIVLFGTLTLLLSLALGARRVGFAGRSWPPATVGLVAFVIVEEASQGLLSNRTLDPADLMANFVGIGLATAAAPPIRRRLARL